MHQLTIDHDNTSVAISGHRSFSDAHHALLKYVVGADYYLRSVQTTPTHASYELLSLADPDDRAPARHPRVAGIAIIEELAHPAVRAPSPYFAACDACRWLGDHADKWVHGSPTDPGDHYPMSVLTKAHREARGLLDPGALLCEAAYLAGAEHAGAASHQILEALRHNAISAGPATHTPAAVAGVVQALLPANVDEHQIAALIWYYALILWGVSTL